MTKKGQRLESGRSRTPPVPVAIIGMGCLFPQAEDLARYWANIRTGVDAITDVPETHWRPTTTSTATPRPPTGPTPAGAGSSTPVDFPPLDFGIAPNSHRGHRHHPAPRPAGRPPRPRGRRLRRWSARFDRDRVSVILGVTGTLELVIPLGARLGHPIWRRALQVGRRRRRDRRGRRPPDRRLLRRLAGELVPRPARQRRRRPDRQPPRPPRHQLRRRRRLRQLARRRQPRPPRAGRRPLRHRRHRRTRYVQ